MDDSETEMDSGPVDRFQYPTEPFGDRPAEDCVICLEPFKPDTPVCTFPCQHILCHTCFVEWADVAYAQKKALECPLCRIQVPLPPSTGPIRIRLPWIYWDGG